MTEKKRTWVCSVSGRIERFLIRSVARGGS